MQIKLNIKKIYEKHGVQGIASNSLLTRYKREWFIDEQTKQITTKYVLNLWLVLFSIKFVKRLK